MKPIGDLLLQHCQSSKQSSTHYIIGCILPNQQVFTQLVEMHSSSVNDQHCVRWRCATYL